MAMTTCTHCGYLKEQCQCGKKRNTSGDVVMFNNYTDQRGTSDYSLTSKIGYASDDRIKPKMKLMDELHPIDGEKLLTYLKRTEIGEIELSTYSIAQHLWLTKKGVWACHSSSRYCFICNLVQFNNVNRAIFETLQQLTDISKYYIKVDHTDPEHPPKLSIYTQS